MLDAIRRSKTNKFKILTSLIDPRGVPVRDLLYAPDEVPDEPARQAMQGRINRLKASQDDPLDKVRMFMPGRIVYFEKTHTEVIKRRIICSQSKSRYQPVWIHDRAEMQQVQLSSRLVLDHMYVFHDTTIKNKALTLIFASNRPDFLLRVIQDSLNQELVRQVNMQKWGGGLISSTTSGSNEPLSASVKVSEDLLV